MTRLAALVFLVNTFLPILLVGALIWAGWQSYRAYADLLSAPIAALEAKLSDVQAELQSAREKIEDTQQVLAEKGREVGEALDAAAEPFEAVGTAVTAAANASIPVPKPILKFKDKDVGLGIKVPVPEMYFDMEGFSIDLPQPVKTAFLKLGDGFAKLIGFTTPIADMVDEIQKLGPSLEPLQAQVAELERALTEARAQAARAISALDPVMNVLKWVAYLLGPWLLLSYVCWVWLRMRMWGRMLAGTA